MSKTLRPDDFPDVERTSSFDYLNNNGEHFLNHFETNAMGCFGKGKSGCSNTMSTVTLDELSLTIVCVYIQQYGSWYRCTGQQSLHCVHDVRFTQHTNGRQKWNNNLHHSIYIVNVIPVNWGCT